MLPRRLLLATAFAATIALPAGAQELQAAAAEAPLAPASPPPASAHPAASPVPAGPTADGAVAALRPARADSLASTAQEDAALQRRARGGFSQPEILMIVGGAAILTGLLAGGGAKTVLVIGGAGIGLYGLYQYLQ